VCNGTKIIISTDLYEDHVSANIGVSKKDFVKTLLNQ